MLQSWLPRRDSGSRAHRQVPRAERAVRDHCLHRNRDHGGPLKAAVQDSVRGQRGTAPQDKKIYKLILQNLMAQPTFSASQSREFTHEVTTQSSDIEPLIIRKRGEIGLVVPKSASRLYSWFLSSIPSASRQFKSCTHCFHQYSHCPGIQSSGLCHRYLQKL